VTAAIERSRISGGDKQAKAELGRLEIDEVAIAFGPPAGCEVITQAAHGALLGVRPDPGLYRYSATDPVVQVCLGPAPVGLEEAVRALPRNEHRLDPGSDRAGLLGQRRSARDEFSDLGQVVTSQPEPAKPSGVTAVCVNTTTRRATRRISRRPAIGSGQ
jgi:hypothetical protein